MWRVEVIEVGGTKRVRTLNNKKEVWPTMIGLMNEYKQHRPGLRFCRDDRKENKIALLSRDKQLYIYAYPL